MAEYKHVGVRPFVVLHTEDDTQWTFAGTKYYNKGNMSNMNCYYSDLFKVEMILILAGNVHML